MRRILAVTAALALTLSACGTEPTTPTPAATSDTTTAAEETTAAPGPIIKPFGEPLTGTGGKEVTIESASSDGESTTIALRYKAGDEAIETYNILTPTLNYGEDGQTADVVKLPDVSGVIVPGQSKVITYPFDVAASELSEATLTIMVGLGSASWNGDLQAYIAESSSEGEATTGGGSTAPAVATASAPAERQSIWAPAGQGIQCPGTDARVWDFADCNPSNGVIDPQEFQRLGEQQNQQPAHDGVAIADGGTCPAYLCGYGHDAQGNRNPTSGEIQTQHGCEQGYITDVGLCAAVGSPIQ